MRRPDRVREAGARGRRARRIPAAGGRVETRAEDLSREDGVDGLHRTLGGRPVVDMLPDKVGARINRDLSKPGSAN